MDDPLILRLWQTWKKKQLEDINLFLWGHWYPCFGLLMMSALGFKARVDPSDSPLVCDTCWRLGSQHGGRAIFNSHACMHMYKHWWGWDPGSSMSLLQSVWQTRHRMSHASSSRSWQTLIAKLAMVSIVPYFYRRSDDSGHVWGFGVPKMIRIASDEAGVVSAVCLKYKYCSNGRSIVTSSSPCLRD